MLITLYFQAVAQGSQQLGTHDEHMLSQVMFDMDVNGTRHFNLTCTVKQTLGALADAPIEVSHPAGYTGPFNYTAFAQATDAYYRRVVYGAAGIPAGAKVTMARNLFSVPMTYQFSALPPAGSAW